MDPQEKGYSEEEQQILAAYRERGSMRDVKEDYNTIHVFNMYAM